jgi:hypothetical protein
MNKDINISILSIFNPAWCRYEPSALGAGKYSRVRSGF